MRILLTTFILLFLVCCYPTTSKQAPGCLFESEICLGSTLEEIQMFYPNLIKRDDEDYPYILMDQPYSRSEFSKVDLFRLTYFKFDDQDYLEKFEVSFFDMGSIAVPNYWQELLLAIGKEQLAHYGIKDLDWERPARHEEEIITESGLRINHKFKLFEYDEMVRIQVGPAD